MHLFTLNVKSNPLMVQSKVESDIEHGLALGGVGFWQEIAPKRYKAALARLAAKAGARVFGIEVECPVTLSRWWVPDEAAPRVHRMHGGRAAVTPARYAVEVRTHQATGPHYKVAFIATHFVSSAWSNKHPLTRAWRRARWVVHLAKLVQIVAQAHADGYTVVVGMDANRHIADFQLHPDQIIVGQHGIDGLVVVPAAGLKVTSTEPIVSKAFFTDHDAVSVSSVLSPA